MKGFPQYDIITAPFGQDDAGRKPFIDGPSNAEINFKTGIPPIYSVPASTGGKMFTRHEMNELGYLATIGSFLTQCGYRPRYSKAFAKSIGGYPKGAVLDCSPSTNTAYRYTIVSQIDDNLIVPTLSGEDEEGDQTWHYSDTSETAPWRLVYRNDTISFFPDYSTKKLVKKMELGSARSTISFTVDAVVPQWVYVERSYSGFGKATYDQVAQDSSLVKVNVGGNVGDLGYMSALLGAKHGALFMQATRGYWYRDGAKTTVQPITVTASTGATVNLGTMTVSVYTISNFTRKVFDGAIA